MDPAFKILASSPVPVLMAGTIPSTKRRALDPRSPHEIAQEVVDEALRQREIARLGAATIPKPTPTASGAMENLASEPLPQRVATDWKSQLDPKKRMQDAAKEVASRLKQKLGGTTQDVVGTLLGGPGTLLNKATMQAREDFGQLNVARDDLKTKMWNAFGHKNSKVKWADLPPEERRAITQRVNEITEAEYVRRGMPGTESVLRELLKDSKVGRESRVSFPLQSPQKGPNESDVEYARRRAQFMEEHKGAIDFYRKTGVIPEDPSRSGAIWYDPHAPVDGRQQQFLGGEERFSSKKGMPERYMHRFENFEFVKKDAFGNPLKESFPKNIKSPFTPPATKGVLSQVDAVTGLSRRLWSQLRHTEGLSDDVRDMYQKRVGKLSSALKNVAETYRNDEDEGRVALRKILPEVTRLAQELEVGQPPIKFRGSGGLVNRASGSKDPLDLLIQQESIDRLQSTPVDQLMESMGPEQAARFQEASESVQPQRLRQALSHLASPSDYRMAAESQAAVPTKDLPIQSLLGEPRVPLQTGTFMGSMERVSRTEFSEAAPRIGLKRYGGVFEEGAEKLWNKALTRLAQRL